MTTIYAVTSGSYSDYSICGVFSSKERAQAYIDAGSLERYTDYNDIEEYVLDECVDEISRGLFPFRVIMYKDGSVHEVAPTTPQIDKAQYVHWMDRAYWSPPQPWANFYVWAEIREGAVKIANERRIQALAAPVSATPNLKPTG